MKSFLGGGWSKEGRPYLRDMHRYAEELRKIIEVSPEYLPESVEYARLESLKEPVKKEEFSRLMERVCTWLGRSR